jgi:thymidylate synthase (FAD)
VGEFVRVKLLYHTDLQALRLVLDQKGVLFDPMLVMDHVVYMFEIEDCSRVTTHQLVRHRVASYDQESQRFSAATKEGVVVPPNVRSNEVASKVFEEAMECVYAAYEKLVTAGVPKEDARYILPNGIKTKIVMTISAKSLMHFVWQRTALQAQWEIMELATALLNLARNATPELWTKIIER